MFLKKFISVSVISVLFFTLVANMVCSAEYLYPIGKKDVEPEKCYTLPFKDLIQKIIQIRLKMFVEQGKRLQTKMKKFGI